MFILKTILILQMKIALKQFGHNLILQNLKSKILQVHLVLFPQNLQQVVFQQKQKQLTA